jgi:hypothetical protein
MIDRKKWALLVCVVTSFGNSALAADQASQSAQTKKPPELTTEQRKKMADQHEKMATCLRSKRPLSECRQEMMKGCQDVMGKEGCPMMGKMGPGMHHHHGMDDQEKGKE